MISVGVREVEFLDQVGAAAVGEPVDQRGADRGDQIALPPRQRLLGERLRDQRPVAPVLGGLVHSEDDVLAEHVAEGWMMIDDENVSLSRNICWASS